MMCLGWKQQKECNELTEPLGCGDATWFWLGLAVVAAGAMFGKKKNQGNQSQAA